MTSIVNGIFSGESKPDVISRSRMHLREGVKMLRVTTRRGSVENGFMDSNFSRLPSFSIVCCLFESPN